jgi:hypothetical protein
VTKPPDCRCDYPELLARNMTGHDNSCPAHARLIAEILGVGKTTCVPCPPDILIQTHRHGDWIQTFTGRPFWPLDPRPEDVVIEDIARALSNQCRFAGHTRSFYSVAQHSVLVSIHCDPADALKGLLHDASESYLSDVCRPLKVQPEMRPYREAEHRIMGVICDRFGLTHDEPASVRRADHQMLFEEKRMLLSDPPMAWGAPQGGDPPPSLHVEFDPLPPTAAESSFLARFAELAPGESTRPCPPEDRGSPVYVWVDRELPGMAWFSPEASARRYTLSVPIGWELRTDPDLGVILARPCAGPEHVLTAGVALMMAKDRLLGFAIRERTRS